MKTSGLPVRGFKLKDGKLVKIAGFGVPKYAQIAKKNKAKKPRVASRSQIQKMETQR